MNLEEGNRFTKKHYIKHIVSVASFNNIIHVGDNQTVMRLFKINFNKQNNKI